MLDFNLELLKPKDSKYIAYVGDGIYLEVCPDGAKYFLYKTDLSLSNKGFKSWFEIGKFDKNIGDWTIEKAIQKKLFLSKLMKQDEQIIKSKEFRFVKRKSFLFSARDTVLQPRDNQEQEVNIIAEFIEYLVIDDLSKNIFNGNNTCYIILGHEIDRESFELSNSGKERCKLLSEKIKSLSNQNYFVMFMGLGRLQGECKLSISECMFEYFKREYFIPANYVIEKRSVDTIGDAFFSYELINLVQSNPKICVITSDWHGNRSEIVFNKIFGSKFELSYCVTSELQNITVDARIIINYNEQKSINMFNKKFKDYNLDLNNPYDFLTSKHNLYK